jgi:hypothetical protein
MGDCHVRDSQKLRLPLGPSTTIRGVTNPGNMSRDHRGLPLEKEREDTMRVDRGKGERCEHLCLRPLLCLPSLLFPA